MPAEGPAKTFFAYMEAVLASDLTPTQRLVLLVQAKHADAFDGELANSFPSEEKLCRETGLGNKAVYNARKALVELGWLIQTHSGRGGSSKQSNSYDLAVPDEPNLSVSSEEMGSGSNRHYDGLQTVPESRQTVPESRSNRPRDVTSTPSSTPGSTPCPTAKEGSQGSLQEGTKEGRGGDSYWVGISKNRPDGYFIRVEGNTRPKGNVVRVDLTRTQVINLFGVPYSYDQRLGIMLGYAQDAGLRPPSGLADPGRAKDISESIRAARADYDVPAEEVPANKVPARVLSRAERDELYGLPPLPITVVRHSPPARSEQDKARDILEGRWR